MDIRQIMMAVLFLALLGLVWVYANRFAGNLATRAGV